LCLLILLPLFIGVGEATAQIQGVQCGDIIEGEFTDEAQVDQYSITIQAGASFRVTARPGAGDLKIDIAILDPAELPLINFRVDELSLGAVSTVQTPALLSRGPFTIMVSNAGMLSSGRLSSGRYGMGAYTLQIGCTLENGLVIEPGDTPQGNAFSGLGFPGIEPIDFGNVVTLPLDQMGSTTGMIAPGFSSVLGYTFTGNSGDVVQLDFERLSGNLNLGIAVLSARNQIVFQASLVTANNLSTEFVLPMQGAYTIGVFRTDLLPPEEPANTSFEITGVVNP
jgi:hypothetical protein